MEEVLVFKCRSDRSSKGYEVFRFVSEARVHITSKSRLQGEGG